MVSFCTFGGKVNLEGTKVQDYQLKRQGTFGATFSYKDIPAFVDSP